MKAQPILGRRLKALRVSRGLSLKEVGAETGLSSSFLSMVETGRNELTVGRLVKLADFYEVSLGDILPERDPEQPVVLRRGERQAFDSADRRVKTEPLASWHYGAMATGFLRFEAGAAEGVKPYVRVRGDLWALVKRALFYDLVEMGVVEAHAGEDWFGVRSGGVFFPMRPAREIEGL